MALDVRAWLQARGFGELADRFESLRIDGDALPLLTDEHLKELDVPLGQRVKLSAELATLARSMHLRDSLVERRRLTVMFVDLVGSTALATQLDPEDLRDLIRLYQSAVAVEVARFDGHLARYIGDGVLVYFGYPRAHEDDAERAIRAARAIVDGVASLRSPAGLPLAAHIGIATGLVVVGDLLGAGGATELAVLGETPNLAARLLDIAAPGAIVISAQTRLLAGNVFELQDLGPQLLKGMPSTVSAYLVAAERKLETRFEAHRGAHMTKLVGRDADIALLYSLWEKAANGQGQVLLLTGEAGIGKSRLLRSLSERLASCPYTPVINQCSPYQTDNALYPMIRQVQQSAGVDEVTSPRSKLERLEWLLQGADEIEIALIADLLGLKHRLSDSLGLTPDQQRARTFEALLSQLLRVSRSTPVFWVMEDAHWIDPTTNELIEMFLDRIAAAPILAVITARAEHMPSFAASAHITRLNLGRLESKEIAAMVTALADGKTLPALVLSEIITKTDGVPLYVEELTKAVLESGKLHETGQTFVLDGPLDRLALPESLHDSMMARLDRHPSLKEVAQTAACIGREFERQLLGSICALPDAELRRALSSLESAEIVFQRRPANENRYVFKHALVRDAAYESLLLSKRREIHSRIVNALESSSNASPGMLALHAFEAGDDIKAIDYWQQAGAAAIERPAYAEAASYLKQALRLASLKSETPQWLERRLQLLMLLGQATIPLRGYSHSEALHVFMQARTLVEELGNTSLSFSTSYALWVIYYVRGEHLKAFDVAQSMLQRAEKDQNSGRMLTALRAQGISQMILGSPLIAWETFERAHQLTAVLRQQSREHRIAVAQRFGADPDIATQFHVALTLWALGRIDDGISLAMQTVEAARAMGHVHTLGHALAHGAIVAVVARETATALALSAETIAFAEEHEMDLWRGYGAILRGYALVLSGDTASALPVMEHGFRLLQRTETGAMLPPHQAVYAFALTSQGRYEDAARAAELVRQEISSGTERYYWPDCLQWLGACLRLMPARNHAEIESVYLQSLQSARQQRAVSWELVAATGFASYLVEQGEFRRPVALLAPLLPQLSQGEQTRPLRDAHALMASLRTEVDEG